MTEIAEKIFSVSRHRKVKITTPAYNESDIPHALSSPGVTNRQEGDDGTAAGVGFEEVGGLGFDTGEGDARTFGADEIASLAIDSVTRAAGPSTKKR